MAYPSEILASIVRVQRITQTPVSHLLKRGIERRRPPLEAFTDGIVEPTNGPDSLDAVEQPDGIGLVQLIQSRSHSVQLDIVIHGAQQRAANEADLNGASEKGNPIR